MYQQHAYLLVRSHRYGLGTCYLRMSKIRLAEYHFRKAAEIHPRNAVLLGCVGMVRNKSYLSYEKARLLIVGPACFYLLRVFHFTGCRT